MKTTIPILAAVALIAAPLVASAQVDVRVEQENPNYEYHRHHHHRHYRTVKVVRYINGERIVSYRRVYDYN